MKRYWFTTRKGYTAADGKYSCNGRFERSANYSFEWGRYQFSVGRTQGNPNAKISVFFKGKYRGPKKTGDWNVDIGLNSRHYKYVVVFQAAYHYYYKNILGLRRPPQNGFLKPKTRIAVYDQSSGSLGDHRTWVRQFPMPRLRVWRSGRTNQEVYATTIHELAHASHWELRKRWWGRTDDKVKESWARGVQWALTRMVYPDYRGGGFVFPNYTEVVIDMIDDLSGTDHNEGSENLGEDNVSGYTIKQIENVLGKTKTWDDWRRHIFNDYPSNPTRNNLTNLFNHWNTRRQ